MAILLIEKQLSEPIRCLDEGVKDGKKSLYIEGVFMQAGIKNRNGRVYPKGVMEEALNTYIGNKVARGAAYGELTHPSGPNIDANNVSHLIERLSWDGDNVMGRAKIGGPKGESVVKLMELGGSIGVSSRGLGSLKPNRSGIMEVQNDYKIATAADIVLDPSAPDAYVRGIMENVSYFYDLTTESWLPEKLENTRKQLRKMSTRSINEAKLNVFKQFLSDISKLK